MGKIKVRCKDCKGEWEIDEDTPLNQTQVPLNHTWHFRGRKYELRHKTEEDYREAELETGCELG